MPDGSEARSVGAFGLRFFHGRVSGEPGFHEDNFLDMDHAIVPMRKVLSSRSHENRMTELFRRSRKEKGVRE
jgi:hypothetical protein